jgi:ERCC4-related helicase
MGMDNFGGMEMITNLVVNEIEITVEYDLDISAVFFGDLESEYVEIDITKIMWMGNDVLPLIHALEGVETLKLIIRDRFEDIQ